MSWRFPVQENPNPVDFADFAEQIDVAVIGGGVAGCYLAYRLTTPGLKRALRADSPLLPLLDGKDNLNVALYESSGRIGGRLWSIGSSDIHCEAGAMRFIEQMNIVSSLIRHFGLEPLVTNFHFDEPENFFYGRGVGLRLKELTSENIAANPGALPYNFAPGEKGKSAANLILWVADSAIAGFGDLSRRYHAGFQIQNWNETREASNLYLQRKYSATVNGEYLYKMSWGALLRAFLSGEAVAFVRDCDGYDCVASNGNAASWLDTIFYTPPSVQYKGLASGLDILPRTLLERFQATGGQAHFFHRLSRFDKCTNYNGSATYVLTFRRHDDQGESAARPQIRTSAKAVVLAIPKPSLQLIDQDNFFFRAPAVQTGMQSVLSVNAFKLFMAYPDPWWERRGVSRGRSTTDLPVRQVYYGRVEEPKNPEGGVDAANRPRSIGGVLTVYASGRDAEYWNDLQGGEMYAPLQPSDPAVPILEKECYRWRPSGGHGDTRVCDLRSAFRGLRPATTRMVRLAHAMLLEMHHVEKACMPAVAFCQNWSAAPYGVAWHVWRPNFREDEVIPVMRQPLPDERVYIAGECWSNVPGSVQGALNSSECLLQDCLGLDWPDWLPLGGTDLGPRTVRPGHAITNQEPAVGDFQ
jgi:lysine 2-monooxygenase